MANHNDKHFQHFQGTLEGSIADYGDDDLTLSKADRRSAFLEDQKQKFETLVALEKQFRAALIGHRSGESVYREFVEYVCETRGNILDARPYFRERQGTFTKFISKALHQADHKALYKFNFNFRFVQFALGARRWYPNSDIKKIAAEIVRVREELATKNMPLAISRARIFFNRTPKAHLSFMDLVQIASEGLMAGIDKFVPPFTGAFRAVIIGRITGNHIEQCSETDIKFWPGDKRKLYRARKAVGKMAGCVDYDIVSEAVNVTKPGQKKVGLKTTPAEIAGLMAAASTVSMDAPLTDDDDAGHVSDRFAAPASTQPDVRVEKAEAMAAMQEALKTLTVFERKLLRLRGMTF